VSGTDPVPIARGEWIEVGRTLRRFHDAGVDHADLHAHNILFGPVELRAGAQESSPDANVGVDAVSAVWLIDFDRGVLRAPGRWREANLRRLARSVEKVAGGGDPSGWSALLDGYRAEPTG